mgnify:CR=1 FL=1
MIEAVDWRDYDSFFAQCRRLLSDERVDHAQPHGELEAGVDAQELGRAELVVGALAKAEAS